MIIVFAFDIELFVKALIHGLIYLSGWYLTMVRRSCQSLRYQIVLVMWLIIIRNHAWINSVSIIRVFLGRWQIYWLMWIIKWWFNTNICESGIGTYAVSGLVEVLGGVVQHLLGIHMTSCIQFLLVLLYFFVEAATCWAYPWISWRLSLPFNILNNFSCLTCNFTIWVNRCASLHIIKLRGLHLTLIVLWWTHLLICWCVLHKLIIIDPWIDSHLPIINNHRRSSISIHIMTLLRSITFHLSMHFSTLLISIVILLDGRWLSLFWDVLLDSYVVVVFDGGPYSCCLILCLGNSTLVLTGRCEIALFDCRYRSSLWKFYSRCCFSSRCSFCSSCFLLPLAGHHILEIILILLSKDASPLFPFTYKIIWSC